LYESLWNLAGFGFLLLLRRWNPRRGEIFFSYLIWYSIGRFFIEGLRTDSLTLNGPAWLVSILNGLWSPMKVLFTPGVMENGNIRGAQLMSLVIVVFAIFMILLRRSKGWANESYKQVELTANDETKQEVQLTEA
jgi:phosphatidylglycerol:prolipoprotein diacylglycerol transferase